MVKNLFLYILLIVGLMSCNLDSKLSDNKEQKNNNGAKKEGVDSVQKDFAKNLEGEQEYKNLAIPVKPAVNSGSFDNEAGISNIPIKQDQKKEIKKEDLTPVTDEEKRAYKIIKNIEENILESSGFSELIKNVCILKNEYALIRGNFYDVLHDIQNKLISMKEDYKKNKDKIRILTQLLNKSRMWGELDRLINDIEIAEQEIKSAATIFKAAQESLKDSIIQRLKNNNKASLQLSKQAVIKAESALENLESHAHKKLYSISKKEELIEFIEDAKTVLANLNA
ncbi:P12 family lipoprotein [Borreliella burgdorferi]|uniref:P12 family lipoprotein n=1 Tax=Borreliella burgdorferi TaxID=139 RepID=UPI000D034AC2|nr:P12 family lipoprotein [Borreliella burgdorferi]MCD2383616.1 P12 family lipoprotein [Borreliella burgdorferi]MCD2389934.1 P12 family lipoprotein [Borreliella burgdorferi]MCD2394245.1 P12 family lipoprotein [Borreliella burgdorferi]MCD2396000.1 P12 family lipoprotein [Borreliella burgdorferi]MCD2397304.1 P12 family lipoprotein [Borreliella burgdorferi]